MQPREKLKSRGIDAMKNVELVAAIVSSGVKGRGYMEVSEDVLNVVKKLADNKKILKLENLLTIEGVGEAKAIQLLAGIELGKRLYGLNLREKKVIHSTEEAYYLLKDISHKKREYMKAIFLNARFEVVGEEIVSIGGLVSTQVLPRDIIIAALEFNAASVVIAHNHPSGGLSPSQEDVDVTKRIQKACDLVGVDLLDHIIVSQEGWRSIPVVD